MVNGVQQRHHFARRRKILAPLFGGLKVHHLAAQTCVGKAERVKHGIYILQTNAVDQHIGCGIVADRDHHGRQIAQGNSRNAGRQAAHDVAVGHEIGRLYRI